MIFFIISFVALVSLAIMIRNKRQYTQEAESCYVIPCEDIIDKQKKNKEKTRTVRTEVRGWRARTFDKEVDLI